MEYKLLAIAADERIIPEILKQHEYKRPNMFIADEQLIYFIFEKHQIDNMKKKCFDITNELFESIYTYRFKDNDVNFGQVFCSGDIVIDLDSVKHLDLILAKLRKEKKKFKLYSTSKGFHILIKNSNKFELANIRILKDKLFIEQNFPRMFKLDYRYHTYGFPFRMLSVENKIRHDFKKEKVKVGHNSFDYIFIDACNICDLNCRYCFSSKIGDSLTLKIAKDIMTNVKTNKVHLSGSGEPFLNPEIYDILKYLTTKTKEITLASHLLSINFDKLDKHNILISKIFVNMTCYDIKSYLLEKQNTGNFETLMNNIAQCRNRNIKIVMTNIIHKKNHIHIPKMLAFAKKHNITNVSFRMFKSIDKNKDLKLSKSNVNKILEYKNDSISNIQDLKTQLKNEIINNHLYKNCDACDKFCRFDIDGKQYPCCIDLSIGNAKNNLKFKNGNKIKCRHCGMFVFNEMSS